MEEPTQDGKLKKRVRSTAYPAIGLEEAIQCTDELRKKLGPGPYSREAAAQALNYKGVSGASASKIAALSHFGLLSRTGDTYRQSPLADRILIPTSDEDKKLATIEAVKTPTLYYRLINDFAGKSLPSMLNNILFHTHKINEKVTKVVASDFEKSIEYAGLLQNGVVTEPTAEPEENSPTTPSQGFDPFSIFGKSTPPPARTQPVGVKLYPVRLPSGIDIHFPEAMGYKFALGEFSVAIKTLETKAQEILKGSNETELLSPDKKLEGH